MRAKCRSVRSLSVRCFGDSDISCFGVSGNRPIQWFGYKDVMSVMLIFQQC